MKMCRNRRKHCGHKSGLFTVELYLQPFHTSNVEDSAIAKIAAENRKLFSQKALS